MWLHRHYVIIGRNSQGQQRVFEQKPRSLNWITVYIWYRCNKHTVMTAHYLIGRAVNHFLIWPTKAQITYLPHKAVAEVSKDKEPIGRGACGVQLIRKSIEIRLKWSEIQMILVVNWFGIQVIRLSIDSEFKWFGCRMIWDSSDLVVNWFEVQMIWLSIDSRFKSWFSIDLRFKWFGC